jgi:hypothetical protein
MQLAKISDTTTVAVSLTDAQFERLLMVLKPADECQNPTVQMTLKSSEDMRTIAMYLQERRFYDHLFVNSSLLNLLNESLSEVRQEAFDANEWFRDIIIAEKLPKWDPSSWDPMPLEKNPIDWYQYLRALEVRAKGTLKIFANIVRMALPEQQDRQAMPDSRALPTPILRVNQLAWLTSYK